MTIQCCCAPAFCRYLDTCILYDVGEMPANYPVPAIRLEVDICETWHKTIAVFDAEWNTIVKEWYGIDDTVTDWEGPQYTFNI